VGQPTGVRAFMTLYGWADNSPRGPAIAHPCRHAQAGGTGTYANPITFATDVAELGWCQVIYVPYMQRYFIHEDECTECDGDWTQFHRYRFDMWAGGDANAVRQPEKRTLRRCESTWTRADSIDDPDNPTVIVDPPSDLTVTTAPIFSASTGCWPGPIALADPGRQTSVTGARVDLALRATDTDTGQTLTFRATNLPRGLVINVASGVISGTPSVSGHKKVTLTASDPDNSASVTIAWVVKRR